MKSTDVQDELAEGFEPTALPPIGPDGGLELEPQRAAPLHPPRLCEQGPCRNYHRFQIELDAAKPMAVRDASGKVTPAAEGRAHAETHHYCYPSPGIELKLGGLPIFSCNRWDPITPHEARDNEARIKGWFESQKGREYTAELEAFRLEQSRIAAEEAAGADEATADLAEMPTGMCELKLEIRNPVGVNLVATLSFAWDETLTAVLEAALCEAVYTEKTVAHLEVPVSGCACQQCIPGRDLHASYKIYRFTPNMRLNRPLDPTHTISQVGLISGDVVIFDYQPPKENP